MTASRAFHPVAEIFPPLEGAEFAELAADIRRNGLIDPIVIHDGQVLDGRNRYRACIEADIEPRFTPFRGDDPVSYVVSRNLRRRHLDESQRAMVVAKLTTLRLGDNQHSEGVPIGRGSALLNVSERSVARAREVRKLGVPELVTAVEAGRVTVTAASEIATLPPDQQREVITLAKCDLVAVAKQIRAKEAESRRAERIARIAAVSTAEPLPQDRKYPVILADPPWRFEPYDRETGLDRAADTHYPTMTTADIKALKIPAADDAVLFLWATCRCCWTR
jgi:MT-A70/ParB/Sulfiredoxin domain